MSYTVESNSFTLNNPSLSGYVFKGWSGTGLSGDNNKTVTINKGSAGNRSYVANFYKDVDPVYLTINNNDTYPVDYVAVVRPDSGTSIYRTGNLSNIPCYPGYKVVFGHDSTYRWYFNNIEIGSGTYCHFTVPTDAVGTTGCTFGTMFGGANVTFMGHEVPRSLWSKSISVAMGY